MRTPEFKTPFAEEKKAAILTKEFKNFSKRLEVVASAMQRTIRSVNKDYKGLHKKLDRFFDDCSDVPMDLYREYNKAKNAVAELESLQSLLIRLNP